MLVSNKKSVLFIPKLAEPTTCIVGIQMPVCSPNLENYYNKQETDDLLNDKLSTNDLDSAIDNALKEAKESGDFKGEKGEQGIQGERGEKGEQGVAGKDGKDGANGISATHSWNGTTLTITSASGTSSANLKGEQGENGKDGYTPIKGTDYFTNADKQEFIADLTPTIESMINQAIGEIEYGTY